MKILRRLTVLPSASRRATIIPETRPDSRLLVNAFPGAARVVRLAARYPPNMTTSRRRVWPMEMTPLMMDRWLKASTMPISPRRTATAPMIRPILIPFCQRPKPGFISLLSYSRKIAKSQISSTEFQTISKFQSPNPVRLLEFAKSEFIWDLVLGIS